MYSVNFKGYRFLMIKHKCPEFMMIFIHFIHSNARLKFTTPYVCYTKTIWLIGKTWSAHGVNKFKLRSSL